MHHNTSVNTQNNNKEEKWGRRSDTVEFHMEIKNE